MISKSGIVSFRPAEDVRDMLEGCSKRGYNTKSWFINRALRFYKKHWNDFMDV